MKKSKRHDGNFNPEYVRYKGKIYATGNRYHTLIEIYKHRKFYKTVQMRDVKVVK